MNNSTTMVDHSALRVNQASIIVRPAPALAQVQRQLDGLPVLKLDAVEHQRLADYYHVMTVPTTVVLDSQRRPVAVNHGMATAERLLTQLGQANVTRSNP